MFVILKRIHDQVRANDIHFFLEPALQGGFFKKTGHIQSIKIEMIQDKDANKTEINALVDVEPDAVAQRVIKNLNRKSCNGKPINIAEYFYRYHGNDPRQSVFEPEINRRKADRRRKNLQVTDITMEIDRNKLKLANAPVKDLNWY